MCWEIACQRIADDLVIHSFEHSFNIIEMLMAFFSSCYRLCAFFSSLSFVCLLFVCSLIKLFVLFYLLFSSFFYLFRQYFTGRRQGNVAFSPYTCGIWYSHTTLGTNVRKEVLAWIDWIISTLNKWLYIQNTHSLFCMSDPIEYFINKFIFQEINEQFFRTI